MIWRITGSALLRDVALVCLADGIIGVSFGAATVASGLPWWVPVAMSVLVFGGSAQIAAVGVVLAGGGPVAAVVAGAVLNTRLLPYGFAVADIVGAPDDPPCARVSAPDAASAAAGTACASAAGIGRGRRWARLLGAQVITDESVAFALRATDPAGRRTAFWTCGLTLFAAWNASVLLGIAIGSVLKAPDAFGLDATFPAVLIALALPALADRRTRWSAGTGAAIAVALTPLLPAGLPVLASLGGLAAGWRPAGRGASTRRGPASARHGSGSALDRRTTAAEDGH